MGQLIRQWKNRDRNKKKIFAPPSKMRKNKKKKEDQMIQSLEKWKNVLNYNTVKPHITLNNSFNRYLEKMTCDH